MKACQTLCQVAAGPHLSSTAVRLLALGGDRSRLGSSSVDTCAVRRHVQSSIRCALPAPCRGCWQPHQLAAAGGACWAAADAWRRFPGRLTCTIAGDCNCLGHACVAWSVLQALAPAPAGCVVSKWLAPASDHCSVSLDRCWAEQLQLHAATA